MHLAQAAGYDPALASFSGTNPRELRRLVSSCFAIIMRMPKACRCVADQRDGWVPGDRVRI